MITNLNNTHLTDVQVTDLQNSLTQMETSLQSLTANLTPEERSRYGTVNEQNKLFVNKVYDFHQSSPEQSSPDLDWNEFMKDYKSRQVLESAIARLDAMRVRLLNSKILHDFDNYQAALDDYAWTKYKAAGHGGAYETKYKELKQFFSRTSSKKPAAGKPSEESQGNNY